MRTRRTLAIGAAALTVIGACSAIAVVELRHDAGHTGVSSSTSGKPGPTRVPTSVPSPVPLPLTRWHYAANGNFGSSGQYLPGADGFNLADVSSKVVLDSLPAGVRGLDYLGTCAGATSSFDATVDAFAGDAKLFGFYVVDEPNISSCSPAHLKAENDWIHDHVPGAHTFAILENQCAAISPCFGWYTPANSDLDLIGLDPYPVRSELRSPDYAEIGESVAYVQTEAAWPLSSIVPVFQAFGGGTWGGNATWTLPTPGEEQQLLATWASVLPAPLFDYAYSWGQQKGDTSLSMSPGLQQVFAAHNALSASAA